MADEIDKLLRGKKPKKKKLPVAPMPEDSPVKINRAPVSSRDGTTGVRKSSVRAAKKAAKRVNRPKAAKRASYAIPPETQKELTKLRRRSYDKQRRIFKKYGVPQTRPTHSRTFASAEDLSRFMEQLQQYNTRGYEPVRRIGTEKNGFYISSGQYSEIESMLKMALERRAQYYKDVGIKPIVVSGRPQDMSVYEYAKMERQQPGMTYYDFIYPLQFEPENIRTPEQLERVVMRLRRQSDQAYWDNRTATMYNNFIQAIRNVSERTGVDGTDLIKDIMSLTPEQFLEMFYRSKADFESIFYNSPEDVRFGEDAQRAFMSVRQDIAYMKRGG